MDVERLLSEGLEAARRLADRRSELAITLVDHDADHSLCATHREASDMPAEAVPKHVPAEELHRNGAAGGFSARAAVRIERVRVLAAPDLAVGDIPILGGAVSDDLVASS